MDERYERPTWLPVSGTYVESACQRVEHSVGEIIRLKASDFVNSKYSQRRMLLDWIHTLQSECEELEDALSGGNHGEVIDELGDVMGAFASLALYLELRGIKLSTAKEVLRQKYERRKPHIFTSNGITFALPESADHECEIWDEAKMREPQPENL